MTAERREDRQELVEAKSSAGRDETRFTLGQLLDYARYVDHEELAVLLPARPVEDLLGLLVEHGVNCIHRRLDGGFDRADARRSV